MIIRGLASGAPALMLLLTLRPCVGFWPNRAMTLFTSLGTSADCRGLTEVSINHVRTGNARVTAFSFSWRGYSSGWSLQGKVGGMPTRVKVAQGCFDGTHMQATPKGEPPEEASQTRRRRRLPSTMPSRVASSPYPHAQTGVGALPRVQGPPLPLKRAGDVLIIDIAIGVRRNRIGIARHALHRFIRRHSSIPIGASQTRGPHTEAYVGLKIWTTIVGGPHLVVGEGCRPHWDAGDPRQGQHRENRHQLPHLPHTCLLSGYRWGGFAWPRRERVGALGPPRGPALPYSPCRFPAPPLPVPLRSRHILEEGLCLGKTSR
jgi:hypothetical protein